MAHLSPEQLIQHLQLTTTLLQTKGNNLPGYCKTISSLFTLGHLKHGYIRGRKHVPCEPRGPNDGLSNHLHASAIDRQHASTSGGFGLGERGQHGLALAAVSVGTKGITAFTSHPLLFIS